LLALAFALITLPGFRQDDLDCEQAVSHLRSCCPGLDPSTFDCTYVSGCGKTDPTQFSIAQSQCIEGLSCDQIGADGLCTSAASGSGPLSGNPCQ
jgi:hypothetical protein